MTNYQETGKIIFGFSRVLPAVYQELFRTGSTTNRAHKEGTEKPGHQMG